MSEKWKIRESGRYVTVLDQNGDPLFHNWKDIDGTMENAHLIAAAPEMLALLNQSRDLLGEFFCARDGNPDAQLLADINRVIALAEGGEG